MLHTLHNIRGLMGNLNDLQIASRNYDIILCSETMVSFRRHKSEILILDFNKPTLLLKSTGKQWLTTYIITVFLASLRNESTRNCHEIQLVKIVSRTHNFYVLNLFRRPSS